MMEQVLGSWDCHVMQVDNQVPQERHARACSVLYHGRTLDSGSLKYV